MKRLLIIIILLVCISCTKDKYIEEKYPNGNLKSRTQVNSENIPDGKYELFYPTGEIKAKSIYKKGLLLDTVYTYHKNGMLESKGKQKNNLPFGWLSFYDLKGKLIIDKEVLIINQKSYLNQIKYYSSEGKIEPHKSSYFELLIKDTLALGGNRGEIIYNHDTLGYQQRYIRIIVDNQYSENLVKKDTFVGEKDKNWFGIYNHKIGNKKVSGKIEEQLIFPNKSKTLSKPEYKAVTFTKYFEKEVFVKAK